MKLKPIHHSLTRSLLLIVLAVSSITGALGAETLDEYDSTLVEANDLLEKGKLAEALAAAQAAGRLEPKRFEAPALAAMILHAAGRTNQARQFLAEALKLAPAEQSDELETLKKQLAGAEPAQNMEAVTQRLLGRWERSEGKEPMVFAKDGKCEVHFSDGMIKGTYSISAEGKITVNAKTQGITLTLHYHFEGDRLTNGVVYFEGGKLYWSKAKQ